MREKAKVKLNEDRKKKEAKEKVKIMKKRADAMKDGEKANPVSLLKSSRSNLQDSTVRLENRDKSVTLILDEKKEKKSKSGKKSVKKSKINESSDEEDRGRSKSDDGSD